MRALINALDCRVATLLAMTNSSKRNTSESPINQPSLRAKRGNPAHLIKQAFLDCRVATLLAMTAD